MKSRQAVRTPAGLRDVVEADYRKVVGHAAAERAGPIEEAEREQIGGAKDAIERFFPKQGQRGVPPAAIIGRAVFPNAHRHAGFARTNTKCVDAAHQARGAGCA